MLGRRNLKSIISWLLIILIFAVFFGPRIFWTIKNNLELGKRVEIARQEIKNLEKQNAELKKFIANFKKESYLEKEAKTRLNLKKPGEKVVVIIKEEVKETEAEVKKKLLDFREFWKKIKEGWSKQD